MAERGGADRDGGDDGRDGPVLGGEVVATRSGPIRGLAPVGGVRSFRGIPYAAPPVGARRFARPVAPDGWTEPRDATEFGQPCPQPTATGPIGDEDCLTLNVWAPEGASGLPVIVFLHGGDNFFGTTTGRASEGLYDGAALATHGAVVVTFDFRLGALGFLAHPALADDGASGNWALHDQLAALAWVQDNVAGFGGDPARVMIFGQSSGSYDACALATSPRADGLFRAAVMQSGPCWIAPRADVDRGIQATLTSVGCASAGDVAACLREAPAARFATAEISATDEDGLHKYFYPVVDGHVLLEPPMAALRAARIDPARALVFGTNRDEMTTLMPTLHVTDGATYDAVVAAIVGRDRAAAAETEYLGESAISYDLALFRMFGDYLFHCRVRRAARAAAIAGAPVWRYSYEHTIEDGAIGGVPLDVFKAGHGLELYVLFRDHLELWTPTAAELELSEAMMATWIGLADGTVTDPRWPAYAPVEDPYVVLDTPISSGAGLRADHCDFWDAHDPE